jgi:hypothetical protein
MKEVSTKSKHEFPEVWKKTRNSYSQSTKWKRKNDPTKNLNWNLTAEKYKLMTSNALSEWMMTGATGGDCFFVPKTAENSNNMRTIILSTIPMGKEH